MPKTEAFRDLGEVGAAKVRLRAERDRVQQGLRDQLDLVREPEFRRSLIGDALGDMIQSWRPWKSLVGLLGGKPRTTSTMLRLALGSKVNTPAGRALVSLASLIVPALLERLAKDPNAVGTKLQHELSVSWERIKDYIHERRKAYEEEDA